MINISFSFDCESKWGMLDNHNSIYVSKINHQDLIFTYERLLSLFEKYDAKATFGFVASMLLNFEHWKETVLPLTNDQTKKWIEPIFLRKTDLNDYFLPDLKNVFIGRNFEIASHSLTHVPHGEIEADLSACNLEMSLSKK